MKEIKDIINAYDAALAERKKTALATVVHVEGSSYRRPGARMLVREDGMLTGTISGGCLEGDALRKALLAIHENKNKLVTYDTTNEDDATFGVQLGCNGIVHILFEPLNDLQKNNPLQLLRTVSAQRSDAVLVTLFSLQKKQDQLGTVCSMISTGDFENEREGIPEEIKQTILDDATSALMTQSSIIKTYNRIDQELNAFIQLVHPSVSMIIFGAGNDAIPLVTIGRLSGWDVTVIDGRATHATTRRFAEADKVQVLKAEESLKNITMDKLTVCVLMTHNYNYDLEVLRRLLLTECHYIGILGPKKKLGRMMDELSESGITFTPEQLKKVYSPVGLDIGAESAEEIALSVAAEIKSVLAGTNAQSLRDKHDPIHSRNEQAILKSL